VHCGSVSQSRVGVKPESNQRIRPAGSRVSAPTYAPVRRHLMVRELATWTIGVSAMESDGSACERLPH